MPLGKGKSVKADVCVLSENIASRPLSVLYFAQDNFNNATVFMFQPCFDHNIAARLIRGVLWLMMFSPGVGFLVFSVAPIFC